MKSMLRSLVASFVVAGMVVAGCGQAAPPAPTQAPAKAAEPTKAPPAPAPTKAPEPTKAPAAPTAAPVAPTKAPTAPPTAVPAKKVDYPEKGKAITILVAWAAGSGNDIFTRLLAADMEKSLGVPVQVANRAGAGSQIGMTELAKSKPEGYTLGVNSLQTTIGIYLDPERQAVFGRKDLAPISLGILEPMSLGVGGKSPLKTTKDLVDAAKATPDKVSLGDAGFMSISHMAGILLAKAAGVRFAQVHFTGTPEATAALLGGHVDAASVTASGLTGQIKSGEIRLLGIYGKDPWSMFPDVKTVVAQGYDAVAIRTLGLDAPGGTPKEITALLDGVVKKILTDEAFLKRAAEAGQPIRYMNTAEYTAHWDEEEAKMKMLLPILKQEQPVKK